MALHAIYNKEFQLLEVFGNKLLAVETADTIPNALETRTFRYLTKEQITTLSYAQAVSLELTMSLNKKD